MPTKICSILLQKTNFRAPGSNKTTPGYVVKEARNCMKYEVNAQLSVRQAKALVHDTSIDVYFVGQYHTSILGNK